MAASGGVKHQPYVYTPLVDIAKEKIANVFGVVKFFKKPFITNRHHLCLFAKIVDPSLKFRDDGEEVEGGLNCVFFTDPKSDKRLPEIISIGDVIRFHRLAIGNFNGKPQGNEGPGFSWIVAHQNGKIESSHKNCTLTEADKKKIKELKEWGQSLSEVKVASSITLLKDIDPDDRYINIIGQVLSWHTTTDPSCIVLRIWDGTIPEFCTFYYCEQKDADEVLFENVPSRVASRTINVHVFENHMVTARKIKAGDFVHITNIRERPVPEELLQKSLSDDCIPSELRGLQEWVGLMVSSGSTYGRGIRILNDNDPEVRTVKERIEQILQEEAGNDDEDEDDLVVDSQSAPSSQQEQQYVNTTSSSQARMLVAQENAATTAEAGRKQDIVAEKSQALERVSESGDEDYSQSIIPSSDVLPNAIQNNALLLERSSITIPKQGPLTKNSDIASPEKTQTRKPQLQSISESKDDSITTLKSETIASLQSDVLVVPDSLSQNSGESALLPVQDSEQTSSQPSCRLNIPAESVRKEDPVSELSSEQRKFITPKEFVLLNSKRRKNKRNIPKASSCANSQSNLFSDTLTHRATTVTMSYSNPATSNTTETAATSPSVTLLQPSPEVATGQNLSNQHENLHKGFRLINTVVKCLRIPTSALSTTVSSLASVSTVTSCQPSVGWTHDQRIDEETDGPSKQTRSRATKLGPGTSDAVEIPVGTKRTRNTISSPHTATTVTALTVDENAANETAVPSGSKNTRDIASKPSAPETSTSVPVVDFPVYHFQPAERKIEIGASSGLCSLRDGGTKSKFITFSSKKSSNKWLSNGTHKPRSPKAGPSGHASKEKPRERPWPIKSASTLNYSAEYVAIKDILTCKEVPQKFHCKAFVVQYEPENVDDMLIVGCKKCNISTSLNLTANKTLSKCSKCRAPLSFEFKMCLLLKDETGVIHVELSGDDAVDFFGIYPLEDIARSRKKRAGIETSLAMMTESESSVQQNEEIDFSNRPIFECFIKSVHSSSKDISYHICETYFISYFD